MNDIVLDGFVPEVPPRTDLWEMVATALRRAIVTGELGPGVHLHEPLLGAKLGVSRVPIREALVRLEHEGLVRSESRRGTFVVGFSSADVSEVYDVRRLVEARAGRLAAARAASEDQARLQQLVNRMNDAVQQGQVQLVAEPDIAFHRQIIAVAAHRRLLAAWEPVAGIVATILSVTNTVHRDMSSAIASHQAIVDALAAHDPEAAEAAVLRHLHNGERVMQEALKELRTIRHSANTQSR